MRVLARARGEEAGGTSGVETRAAGGPPENSEKSPEKSLPPSPIMYFRTPGVVALLCPLIFPIRFFPFHFIAYCFPIAMPLAFSMKAFSPVFLSVPPRALPFGRATPAAAARTGSREWTVLRGSRREEGRVRSLKADLLALAFWSLLRRGGFRMEVQRRSRLVGWWVGERGLFLEWCVWKIEESP